ALSSGFNSLSTVPAGSLPKAEFVGANTVNGPLPSRVSTRPAAFTAATSVVWSFELTAFWMMFLDGYIAAPPTITVFSSARAGATKLEVSASAPNAAAANSAIGLDMESLPIVAVAGGHPPGSTTALASVDISAVVAGFTGEFCERFREIILC